SRFSNSQYRFLCATDAAGMGCNVSNIQNIIIFNCLRSLSAVSQRWGRAGRDEKTLGMCVLLVPEWAY
ncbi:P-loop containing nucleoside triphosphate hydrolase protein, partial [Cerioporus squamosus]